MRRLAVTQAEETVHRADGTLSAHRHKDGYLALVLDGDYDEFSPDGCFRLEAGMLIAHPPFHLHGNRFGNGGARVLNLPWLPDCFDDFGYSAVRLDTLDPVIRRARRDPVAAAGLAGEALSELRGALAPVAAPSWTRALAAALREDAVTGADDPIRERAAQAAISAEHAARSFARYFGLTPGAYRREHRVRRALKMLRAGRSPASVAAECGFYDQSHLNREVRRVTGRTPGQIAASL